VRKGAGRDVRPAPSRVGAAGVEVGRLFELHGRMVFALCNLLLRHRQEAEDATQQAFLSAHRSLLDGTTPEDPAAWIAAIARNECFTRLRRQRPDTVPLFDDDHPATRDMAAIVDERAEIAALSQAIAGLPPAQRQAVLLRDFYGLSYKEVSVALGLTGPAVESLLFKSRKRLQERLRPLRAGSGFANPATWRAGGSERCDPRLLRRARRGRRRGGGRGSGPRGEARVGACRSQGRRAAACGGRGVGRTFAGRPEAPPPAGPRHPAEVR